MKNEPIRHHYIPQFILRNFCIDDLHYVNYYDKKKKKTYIGETRDVFMERNLYRDSINHNDNPTEIEKDLSVFESEVARIINNKFLKGKRIILTIEEHEQILLFFAIMGLRNEDTYRAFCSLPDDSVKRYSRWQEDKDMEDLWKRNLGYIVKCRSLEEILLNEDIDPPFKGFMYRDTCGLSGKYVSVIEYKHRDANFIIGDIYPLSISGGDENGNQLSIPITLYELFPISSNRTILIADEEANYVGKEVIGYGLGVNVFEKPRLVSNNEVVITVKSIFKNNVEQLNKDIFDCSNKGVIYYKSK